MLYIGKEQRILPLKFEFFASLYCIICILVQKIILMICVGIRPCFSKSGDRQLFKLQLEEHGFQGGV